MKALGFDLETGPYRFIKVANDAVAVGREQQARSGRYIDQIHNYAFDFWIGLPASASDAAPDPAKAQRTLAKQLPPLTVVRDGTPAEGQQFEFSYVDLSAHAMPGDRYPGSPDDKPLTVSRDAEGTGYVRMTLGGETPRTLVVVCRFPKGSGLRVRSDSFVKLRFYRDEDFDRRGCLQELYVPDTKGEWNDVIAGFDGYGLLYVQATPLAGSATIDFDRIDDTDTSVIRPLSFGAGDDRWSIPTFVGARLTRIIAATGASASVSYGALNLPSGASFDPATGTLSWTPAAGQEGDHALYVTARDGGTMRTLRVDIHVDRDLQAALDFVARAYDPTRRYVSTTEQAFKAALATRDLVALQRAADGLELLSPRLPDGTLDYRVASSPKELGIDKMADNDPLTWGGLWGFDKNITLDFGARFKVRSDAFRLLTRDGFPIRVADSVVYGSNDRKHWTLLTKEKAVSSPDLQTLAVKEAERTKAYRYLRFFMPAKPFPIFEIAKLRIVGERIEDYSPDVRVAYISGYDDGTFRPDQKLTKAEVVSLLAGLVDDYTDKGAYDCAFVDVPRDAPYFDDVAYMTSKGLVSVDDGKHFHPNAFMTRGELAAIMARMQGLKGDDSPALKNVPPGAPVTRAEFVMAANRMTGRTATPPPSEGTPKFADVKPSNPAYADILKATTTYPVPATPTHAAE